MEAQPTAPRRASVGLWAVLILLAALLVAVGVSIALTGQRHKSERAAPASGAPQIAYFGFTPRTDTLWLANASDPDNRHKLITVAHAEGYGVIPSAAADGGAFVYNVLPPQTRAPGPDSPADLWAFAAGDKKPRLLIKSVDLLVRPVWSPDGSMVIVRQSRPPAQSSPGAYTLLSVDPLTGASRPIASANDVSLFPIGFAPDGTRFYYVRIGADVSELYAVALATGSSVRIAKLADGLTRDWRLSADGSRLAYLVISFDAQKQGARAYQYDLTTGAYVGLSPDGVDAFSPVWTATGDIVIGSLADGQSGAGAVRIDPSGAATPLPGPEAGFDVPLAFDPTDGIVVRSFEGASPSTAGASKLTLITPTGERKQITSEEVTFLGWIKP